MKKYLILLLLFLSCSAESRSVLELSGVVEMTEVNIASEVPGRIEKIFVDEGTMVKKGDVLIKIEDLKYKLQLEQANAQLAYLEKNLATLELNLENAERNFSRIKKLREESAIDEAQFDLVKTQRDVLRRQIEATRSQLDGAKASVELFRKQVNDTVVKSPIDGVVLSRIVEEGEVVAPGIPLLTVGNIAEPWVRTYVPQGYLGKIKLGDEAIIYSDSYPDRKVVGRVVYISDKEEFTPKNLVTKDERAKMVYSVKIAIDNKEGVFKAGQYVDVRLKIHE